MSVSNTYITDNSSPVVRYCHCV